MKNIINFLQTGGVPLTNDVMSHVLEAINIYEVLGSVAGNLTILSGCIINGTQVSSGIVSIDGKVLFFEGGTVFQSVFIHKEDIYKTFEDQSHKLLIERFTVKFGNAQTTYNWNDFVRLSTLKEIGGRFEDLQNQIDALKLAFDGLLAQINGHIANTSNPHSVTAQQVGILKRGNLFIGDVQGKNIGWTYSGADYTITLIQKSANTSAGGDDNYSVVLNSALPTANYMVIGSFKFSNWNNDNDLIYAIGNKTVNGFEFAIREVASNVQNVSFEFMIIQL